eukprot:scaffold1734_cov113-Isochrysis_galbana.AAC.22
MSPSLVLGRKGLVWEGTRCDGGGQRQSHWMRGEPEAQSGAPAAAAPFVASPRPAARSPRQSSCPSAGEIKVPPPETAPPRGQRGLGAVVGLRRDALGEWVRRRAQRRGRQLLHENGERVLVVARLLAWGGIFLGRGVVGRGRRVGQALGAKEAAAAQVRGGRAGALGLGRLGGRALRHEELRSWRARRHAGLRL